MKRRNRLIGIAGTILLAFSGWSCATQPDEIGDLENLDPSGQVVVYWYQHEGSREDTLQEMIVDYNATNAWGVTVEGEHAGSYPEIFEKLVAGIPADRVPNLAVAYQNQAAIYVRMDGVVELSSYINSPKWGYSEDELADFFPFVSLGDILPEFDGRYGFPPHRSMEVLYYNMDWLRELGYDGPPRTWQAFEEMACAATDPEAGTYGYVLSVDASTFADMLFNRGGTLGRLDGSAFRYAFDNEEGLQVVSFLQRLFDTGCAIQEPESRGDRLLFSQGKALFTFSSTSGISDYHRDVDNEGLGFSWSIAPMPTSLGTPRVNIYGASLSILKSTPEKQLASWLFIKWLSEPAQTARWARETGYFPVRRSAAESLQDYFAQNPEYQKAFDFLSYEIALEPGVGSWEECRRKITDMMRGVIVGGNPQEWVVAANQECNLVQDELGEAGEG